MRKPRKWRKAPYYKVQVYNETMKAWKDERKVFETAESAQEFINKEIFPRNARIMVVQRNSRNVLEP